MINYVCMSDPPVRNVLRVVFGLFLVLSAVLLVPLFPIAPPTRVLQGAPSRFPSFFRFAVFLPPFNRLKSGLFVAHSLLLLPPLFFVLLSQLGLQDPQKTVCAPQEVTFFSDKPLLQAAAGEIR